MIERILITVKTYPTLSSKYAELVCTAGVNQAGEWRRIFPVRFRQLQDHAKYVKYQWIQADIEKSPADARPESHRIINPHTLSILGPAISTRDKWAERKAVFQRKVPLHRNLTSLIQLAHDNALSLAHFKPARWLKFVVEPCEREWDQNKLAKLEMERRQFDLFKDVETIEQEFQVVKKLPYKFSYQFEDDTGKQSTLMIEDWEIGALYWKCLRSCNGNEDDAVGKVRQKYWDQFVLDDQIDLTLVLGTTLQFHNQKAPNPFVIISVVPTPVDRQIELF